MTDITYNDVARALDGALEGKSESQAFLKETAKRFINGTSAREAIVADQVAGYLAKAMEPAFQAEYKKLTPIWDKVASEELLNDFRPAVWMELASHGSPLPDVGGVGHPDGTLVHVPELTPYPTFKYTQSGRFLTTDKYGARLHMSWEAFINDDWGLLQRLPKDAARMAAKTKDLPVLGQIWSLTGGFNEMVISDANDTILKPAGPNPDKFLFSPVVKNAPLSLNALRAAILQTTSRVVNGRPVSVSRFTLLVPPSLKMVAESIVGMHNLKVETTQGATKLTYDVANPLGASVSVEVSDLISIMGSPTSWAILPQGGVTDDNRKTIVKTALRGHSEPTLWMKHSEATTMTGQAIHPTEGSFDNDSIEARVRMTAGAGVLNLDGIVASNGTGS